MHTIWTGVRNYFGVHASAYFRSSALANFLRLLLELALALARKGGRGVDSPGASEIQLAAERGRGGQTPCK